MDRRFIPDPADFQRFRRVVGPAETRGLGADLARIVRPGDALLIYGELGAGKTCLVQGLCEALGVNEEVTSPTFTLVNRYRGRLTVAHLDFYRIEPDHDLDDIGVHEVLDELADGRLCLLAEWPELLRPLLPDRMELLAVGGADPQERLWCLRGVPELPAPYAQIFAEERFPC
jgi:tRNA threonylcarbamoyladenosine biosynthesis protein TsaE